MLSVPQPPGTDGDMFEGCPLVHVQETVDDMTRFLRALLEPRYFSRECRYNVTRIVSTLRLATKYNAEELRECVIAHLQDVFPLSSLYNYDVAQDLRWQFGAAGLVTLTNLAYEFELDRLWKPLALTCAVDLDHQQILDGFESATGGMPRASIRSDLSARAKRDVLRVRAGILEHLQDLFRCWTIPDQDDPYPVTACKAQSTCQLSCRRIESDLVRLTWRASLNFPPWSMDHRLKGPSRHEVDDDPSHWRPLYPPRVDGRKLCNHCRPVFSSQYDRVRSIVWNNVAGRRTSWFGEVTNESDDSDSDSATSGSDD